MSLKVSIVTPCFNSAQTIEATIQSVLGQAYSEIEYIVMDGGSIDGTVEIARRYETRLRLISEPDRGQSDAINKGWKMATGDIVAYLNADDRYFPDTIQNAVDYFNSHAEAMWLYGSARSVDSSGQRFPYRNFPREWNYERLLQVGCYITQPSVFLRHQVIEEFGPIDESLHYTMDYEYWLRIGRKYPGHFVPSVLGEVVRSADTKTETGGRRRLDEAETIARRYGASKFLPGMRHEWAIVTLEAGFQHLRTGQWKQAVQDFRDAGRFPGTLPRSLFKIFLRRFSSTRLETWLRQALVAKTKDPQ